jgi:hypothetical protein
LVLWFFGELMRFIAAIGLLAVIALAGCDSGPQRGEVQGKVTFKGQPVKEGRVTFLNTTAGGSAEGQLQPDGSYTVSGGAALGDYVVEIAPLMEMKDTDPGKTPPSLVEKNATDIPRKYRQQGTSPLKATVKAGKNKIDFEMTP